MLCETVFRVIQKTNLIFCDFHQPAFKMSDMQSILEGLQKMKETNPEAFKQAMESIGLPVPESSSSILDEENSLAKIADAIKQMRTSQPGTEDGSDVILSKDAPKQVNIWLPLLWTVIST